MPKKQKPRGLPVGVPPVGQRPQLDPLLMAALFDYTRQPEKDIISPDGYEVYEWIGCMRREPDLGIFLTRWARRGKIPLTVHLGRAATPHGLLRYAGLSYPNCYPSWNEIKRARETFFEPTTTVVQILPEQDTPYINDHPFCLWLWEMPSAWGWPRETSAEAARKVRNQIIGDVRRG